MTTERRGETPVRDMKLRSELNISVILQSLILAAIVGSVTVLQGIKEQMAVYMSKLDAMALVVTDHEGRIRTIEFRNAKRDGEVHK